MIRNCLLALMLSSLFCIGTFSAVAQDNGGNNNDQQSAPEHGRGGGHFDPARRTEMLTKQLNLTSDQQSKVLDILKSAKSQMESVHSDASVPQADRRAKAMEIRKAADDQIRGLLDANQQRKWDAMQTRHEEREGQRQQPEPQQQN